MPSTEHKEQHPIWIEGCRECNTNNCRSGCLTQDHETYWDCLQAANINIDKTSLKS